MLPTNIFGSKVNKSQVKEAEEETKKSQTDSKETKAKADKEIVKLTAGDYTIHFLVQKTKELAISEGSTATIIVEVECGKDHEFTKAYPE